MLCRWSDSCLLMLRIYARSGGLVIPYVPGQRPESFGKGWSKMLRCAAYTVLSRRRLGIGAWCCVVESVLCLRLGWKVCVFLRLTFSKIVEQ